MALHDLWWPICNTEIRKPQIIPEPILSTRSVQRV